MKKLGGITKGGARWVVVVSVLLSSTVWAPRAAAAVVVSGVCEMDLQVTYAPPLRPSILTSATTVTVNGGGPCTAVGTTTGTHWGTLSAAGTATPVTVMSTTVSTFTCAGGVVVGTGHFNLSAPSFPNNASGRAVISLAGSVGTVTLHSNDNRVTATGDFVQSPTDSLSCPTAVNGLATTTWEGVVAFVATADITPPTSGAPLTEDSYEPR